MTVPKRITKSTPVVAIDAADLCPKATIIGGSGKLYTVKSARKRNGVVRVQLDGHKGVIDIPRHAPVNVFSA